MNFNFIDLFQTCIVLFSISLWGIFVVRRNIILVLISLELMLLSLNLLLVSGSVLYDDIVGQITALLILTVAAAESAIGLAILVVYYRLRGVIAIDYISSLKGLL